MERYEIETFLTLAEELHFARSAARLHVTPGRVSQTIKTLERRVGGALFERDSRRVALTSVGRRLRDDRQPTYRQIQQAVADDFTSGVDIAYAVSPCRGSSSCRSSTSTGYLLVRLNTLLPFPILMGVLPVRHS